MNIEQTAALCGLNVAMVNDQSFQVTTELLVKTDLTTGYMGRCGVSFIPETNSWCLVFEVAAFKEPKDIQNVWLTELGFYLNNLTRICQDNFGLMSVTDSLGNDLVSRIAWNVDTVTVMGVVSEEHRILTLAGSVNFQMSEVDIMQRTLPIIRGLVNQINWNVNL